MKKLKIGELSQLVGAPASALRFWEERGITEPEKDSENNYRLYSAGDSCRFLMARRYRSFGFALDDVKTMIVDADPAATAARLESRLSELDNEVQRLAAIRDELSRFRRECLDARMELDTLTPAFLPAARYIFTIRDGCISEDEAFMDLSKRWSERLPRSTFALCIPREAFDGSKTFGVRWGFGIAEDALRPDERPEFAIAAPGIERFDGARCVRTAFYRDDPRDMSPIELAGIVARFKAAGYSASGPAIGRMLQIDRSGDAFRYLYSLYIPIA